MKINWNERKPEIILFSVIAAAILLGVVFVAVYMSIPAPAGDVGTEADTTASDTEPYVTREPEDEVFISSGKPLPEQIPPIIVEYFAYINSGDYGNLKNILGMNAEKEYDRLMNAKDAEYLKLGIYNFKSVRLISASCIYYNESIEHWDCVVEAEMYRPGDVAATGLNLYTFTVAKTGDVYYSIYDIDRDETYSAQALLEHTSELTVEGNEIRLSWIEHGANIISVTASETSGKHTVEVPTFTNKSALLIIDGTLAVSCDYRTGKIISSSGAIFDANELSDGEWKIEKQYVGWYYPYVEVTIMSYSFPAPDVCDGASRIMALYAYGMTESGDIDCIIADLPAGAAHYIRDLNELRVIWSVSGDRIIETDLVEDFFRFDLDTEWYVSGIEDDSTLMIKTHYYQSAKYYFYYIDIYSGEIWDPLAGIDEEYGLAGNYYIRENRDGARVAILGGTASEENAGKKYTYDTAFYLNFETGEYFNVADIDGVLGFSPTPSAIDYIYSADFTDDDDVIIVSVRESDRVWNEEDKRYHQLIFDVASYEYNLTDGILTETDEFAALLTY